MLVDIEGASAANDPGKTNAGRPTLTSTVQTTSQFTATGVAQAAWRGNNQSFANTLPFTFPFFGTNYKTLSVTTEGFLRFGPNGSAANSNNSSTELALAPRIAAMWDNLRTSQRKSRAR